jgi:hypothetical protein
LGEDAGVFAMAPAEVQDAASIREAPETGLHD